MRKLPPGFTLCVAFAVTACSGSGGGNGGQGARAGPPEDNRRPTIAGTPPGSIPEGEQYEFEPTATDADGDTLVFRISGKPAWASFDAASGRLWGTPGLGDAGISADIRISVSDGKASTALAAFSITITQGASGSATISWNPPTRNADASNLANLAGYRIYYGRDPDALDQTVVLNNPGLTRYVVENLSPARWHFAMTSVNGKGRESKRSKLVRKDIA